MDASVLIPSYNDRSALLLCIEHLEAQTHPADLFEVVVVLDGSTDGSYEALCPRSTPLQLRVFAQPNSGRAAALNRAAAAARGRLLIITDSDILTAPAFVERHIAAHADADVVIGPIPLSPRSPVNYLTEGVRRWATEHAAEMEQQGGPTRCTQIYGANLSISRTHFKQLGGYRTDLRRTEDFQLGKKILAAGLRVAYSPDAVAEQLYDKSFAQWCDDFYVDGRSHARLIREFPEEVSALKIGHYLPQTVAKSLLRPLVIRDHLAGRWILRCAVTAMESCRRVGLRWRLLNSAQGLIGDALFWKGVRDEVADEKRFDALTRST